MGEVLLLLVVALTVAAVVFGVTVLVSGRDPGLVPVEPDGRAVPLPGTRPLHESDVAEVRFDTALRGYRMAQVDQAMRRAAYDIGYKSELIGVLEAEIAALREGRTEEADALRRTREEAAGTSPAAPVSGAEAAGDGPADPVRAAEAANEAPADPAEGTSAAAPAAGAATDPDTAPAAPATGSPAEPGTAATAATGSLAEPRTAATAPATGSPAEPLTAEAGLAAAPAAAAVEDEAMLPGDTPAPPGPVAPVAAPADKAVRSESA